MSTNPITPIIDLLSSATPSNEETTSSPPNELSTPAANPINRYSSHDIKNNLSYNDIYSFIIFQSNPHKHLKMLIVLNVKPIL